MSTPKWVVFWTLAAAVLAGGAIVPGVAQADETGVITGKIVILQKDGQERTDASNVVVYVEEAPFEIPSTTVNPVIHQRGKKYLPEVLPVLAGTSVNFVNDDDIFHNVFSPSPAQSFDLGVYEKASYKTVLFDKTGTVNLYCNIHPNMVGYVVALKNPYFTMTEADGSFKILGVPAGRRVVKAWQRYGAEASVEVQVTPGETTHKTIKLSEEKATIGHKNKWGQDYVDPEDDSY